MKKQDSKIKLKLIVCILALFITGCGLEECNTESAEGEFHDDRLVDLSDYSSYLKKIWIVEGWDSGVDYPVSLVITQMEEGYVKGYFCLDGFVRDDYFYSYENLDKRKKIPEFYGTIYAGTAECEYDYKDGRKGTLTITFCENDRIEAEVDGEEPQRHLLRPYHISDEEFLDEPASVSYEVELDSWGTVTLFYAKPKERYINPALLLLNGQGDIIYDFHGDIHFGSELLEVLIEDMNGDGLKDVKMVTCDSYNSILYRFEWFFYQTKEGRFEWFFYQREDDIYYNLNRWMGYNHATQDDIAYIGQLTYLKHLAVSIGEGETDLSPLGNLEELESLYIKINIYQGCSPDLSFLTNLSHLEKLSITVGSDVDLSPLGSLSQLKQLSMTTWSDDLSFLRELDQLTEVILFKCEVEDLSLFQNMPCLQELDVGYVDDCDLNYLANLKNLESLSITGGNIRNSGGLSHLTHLKELHLYDGSLDARYGETKSVLFDMQPIANLTELEWIDMGCIYIEDISPLANLKSLRRIFLVRTDVGDISPLINLENLERLSIYGNESELVKEQAETYFNGVENLVVTEEIPNGLL